MLPNLKQLRQEYRVSQQRLAEAVDVSQPSINKYENHVIEPNIEILKRMADFFDTSVDYIIGHTDIRRKIEHTEAYELNAAESELIVRFRCLTEEEKDCIMRTIQTFSRR